MKNGTLEIFDKGRQNDQILAMSICNSVGMYLFFVRECRVWRFFLKTCRTSQIDDESELYDVWESIEANEELQISFVNCVFVKKELERTGATENEIGSLLQ